MEGTQWTRARLAVVAGVVFACALAMSVFLSTTYQAQQNNAFSIVVGEGSEPSPSGRVELEDEVAQVAQSTQQEAEAAAEAARQTQQEAEAAAEAARQIQQEAEAAAEAARQTQQEAEAAVEAARKAKKDAEDAVATAQKRKKNAEASAEAAVKRQQQQQQQAGGPAEYMSCEQSKDGDEKERAGEILMGTSGTKASLRDVPYKKCPMLPTDLPDDPCTLQFRHWINSFLLQRFTHLVDRDPERLFIPHAHLPKNNFGSTKTLGRCAVVSNSHRMLDHEYGAEIDAHDVIIRMNHAPYKGYEKYVGSRSDIRVINTQHLNKAWSDKYFHLYDTKELYDNTHGIWARDGWRHWHGETAWLRRGLSRRRTGGKNDYKWEIPESMEDWEAAHPDKPVYLLSTEMQYLLEKCINLSGGNGRELPSTGTVGAFLARLLCDEVTVYEIVGSNQTNWKNNPIHYFPHKGPPKQEAELQFHPIPGVHAFEMENNMMKQWARLSNRDFVDDSYLTGKVSFAGFRCPIGDEEPDKYQNLDPYFATPPYHHKSDMGLRKKLCPCPDDDAPERWKAEHAI